ncbi:MAG: hypothetical protein B7X41_04190 [Microbacterium sp. 14-71-5]|nr:MAG: hypothetical protein B7X41_04190 [Microbacterium sp. 14-71-5]
MDDAALDDAARTTYRYLRVSVVALTLLLAVSLALEVARGGERFGSISGYYYSPVRSVLVGTLMAIGPALIAIKGRPGWEDTLLDLAGMAVPLVAFVPTPRELGPAVCGLGTASCVPPEYVPAVRNNVTALLVVGALALGVAWWGARRRGRPAAIGLTAASAAWLTVTVVFVVTPHLFLRVGHYAAALVFFLLTAAVAWLAGRRAGDRTDLRLMSPDRYGRAYRTIATLILATLVVGTGVVGGARLLGLRPWFGTVFVVELALLVLFVVFWVLQTAENWDDEAVEHCPPTAP